MIEAIIAGWWKILALLAGITLALWGAVAGIVALISQMKKSGVDEVSAGPVKIDFSDDGKEK